VASVRVINALHRLRYGVDGLPRRETELYSQAGPDRLTR
jgi:hypothetical protein